MKKQAVECAGVILVLAGTLVGCGGGAAATTNNNGGTSQPAAVAPTVTPSSLTFADTVQGTTAAAQTVTVKNTGTVALSGTISITGTNAADFAETNTCGTSLAGGASCTVSVTFTPTAVGSFTASLSGTAGNVTYPAVSLSGNGISGAAATLAPSASQDMGTVAYGAHASQAVTLSNGGTGSLSITSINLSGTAAADFTQTNTCGTTLAAGTNCTITVVFTPSALGERDATLTLTDDATAGTTQTLDFKGTGAAGITRIVPDSGPSTGGTVISIVGLGLAANGGAPPAVSVGGVAGTNVEVSADGTLVQATVPAAATAVSSGQTQAVTVVANSATAGTQFTYTNLSIGCGTDCGNVGDPYEGQGAPASFQPVSACGQITATGYYKLTQDIGTPGTNSSIGASDYNCLDVYYPSPSPSKAAPFTLDLGGHTVYGTISMGGNGGPYILLNGSVICNANAPNGTSPGPGNTGECILWAPLSGRIHHITVENNALYPLTNINITSTVASSVTTPVLQIDHVTTTVAASAAGANRTRNVMDDGANGSNPQIASMPVEAFNNLVTCSDNASACQGFENYDAANSYYHNNKILLPANCATCGDAARGIIFDTDSNNGVAAFNEFFLNGPNRAVRVRLSQHISVHDNLIHGVQGVAKGLPGAAWDRYGAIHVGESNFSVDDDFLSVFNNQFEMGALGTAVDSSAAADVYVFDNTSTCTSGQDCTGVIWAKTDIPDTVAADQSGTNLNVFNNDLSQIPSPVFHVCGATDGSFFDCAGSTTGTTSATVCNQPGVTITGTGTATQVAAGTPCPPPPVPPVPSPAQFRSRRLQLPVPAPAGGSALGGRQRDRR